MKLRKLYVTITTVINILLCVDLHCAQSNQVDGAIVIVIYYNKHNKRKVFISEENVKDSPFYKTYEGWGGAFDPRFDNNEIDVAAREFWEEALLEKTLGWSFEQTKLFLQSEAVEAIIKTTGITKFFPNSTISPQNRLITKPIFTYIAHMKNEDVKTIKRNFFNARNSYEAIEANFRFREKGNLATIDWNDFVTSIKNAHQHVQAKVYKEGHQKAVQETIELRSILKGALYNHFLAYENQLTPDTKYCTYQCTFP